MSRNHAKGLVLVMVIMMAVTPLSAFAATTTELIDESLINQSLISIDFAAKDQIKTVVRISKDQVNYDYDFVQGAQYPLLMGDGKYTVIVGEMVNESKFKVVAMEDVQLNQQDQTAVYLQSNILLDWNESTKAVVKAQELVQNAVTDREKIEAIYNYVIDAYTYDYVKASTVEAGYVPDLNVIYNLQTGICYDYASITAAMLRSVGIPTKVAMGYYVEDAGVYHAWNQVFLADSNEWITLDTTYDAIRNQSGQAVTMIQNINDYKVVEVY